MTRARLGVIAVLLGAGCAFEPDLTRYPVCDAGACPSGFTCLTEADRCVPTCEATACDAGPPDAGRGDAGATDGGAPDAGLTDAGAPDGGTDAGGPPSDAGTDAGSGVDAGDDGGLAFAFDDAMALPPATETRSYQYQFAPRGGLPPYAYQLDGGVPSFSLSSSGLFSTTAASTPGTFGFEITASDDDTPRQRITRPFSLEVMKLLRVSSGALIKGFNGQSYSVQLAATGGRQPFRWSTDGGLPPGLVLNADGGITGTPQAATRTFTVEVVDSSTVPQRATRQVSLEVLSLALTVVSATPAAADARVGEPYVQALKAYGGTGPYAWTLASGTFPPGISLMDPGTGQQLAGTPTTAGTYNFTLRVDDSFLTADTQALTIVVVP